MFEGFSSDGLSLLAELPGLDKEGFAAQKSRYAARLQQPVKDFVDALGPALRAQVSLGIDFAAKTHGSIGPINNDVRFNPDAPTYKDHVLLRFWEGPDKKTAPTLFVRLAPGEVGFATGTAFADVEAYRAAVDEHGAELATALDALRSAAGAHVVPPDLKRVPKPYPATHPHADLLRHKWMQARWSRALPDVVGGADFVDFCAAELAQAAAVHRWFVARLGAGVSDA